MDEYLKRTANKHRLNDFRQAIFYCRFICLLVVLIIYRLTLMVKFRYKILMIIFHR